MFLLLKLYISIIIYFLLNEIMQKVGKSMISMVGLHTFETYVLVLCNLSHLKYLQYIYLVRLSEVFFVNSTKLHMCNI